jgi:Methyltransferase domain
MGVSEWQRQSDERLARGVPFSYLDVPGWFDWENLYDEVALTTPPYSSIVEVGVAFGKSILYLAQRIRETGKPGIQIYAVDRWAPYPEHHFIYKPETITNEYEQYASDYAALHGGIYPAFLDALRRSGLSDYVNVVRAESIDAARMFASRAPHFVFIDAEHVQEAVALDIGHWWNSGYGLGSGPEWMAGHDYNRGSEVDFPGVWKAVDAKFGQENVEWRGQTCWVVRRSHLERPGATGAGTSGRVQPK